MEKVYLPFSNHYGRVVANTNGTVSLEIDEFKLAGIDRWDVIDFDSIKAAIEKLASIYNRAVTEGHESLTVVADEIYRQYSTRKIQGIKVIRERTGCGLKEAKDAYEAAETRNPTPRRKVEMILQAEYGTRFIPPVIIDQIFRAVRQENTPF